MQLVKDKYIYILYFFSLSVLLPVTLNGGQFLTGTDIHLEYYFAHLSYTNGWNPAIPHPMNGSLGITLLTPFLSKLLDVDMVWIFKILFPLLFSLVPVVLYLIFKKYLTDLEAFLAAIFFIIVPTYLIELPAITRQMLAETFLVLYFLLILGKLSIKYRLPLLIFTGAGAILSHYSIGIVLIAFTIGYFALIVLFKIFRRPLQSPVWISGICLAVFVIGGFLYYGTVANGTPLRFMTAIIPVKAHQVGPFIVGYINEELLPDNTIGVNITKEFEDPNAAYLMQSSPDSKDNFSYLTNSYDTLMRTALGLDFMEVSALGKAFRIFQYITQLLLIIGFIYFIVRFRRLKFSYEYLAFALVSVGVLLLCIVLPGFSSILNATRWYHLALFFLAPMVILGARVTLRNYKVLVAAVLVPYFLFTSGIMFELFKVDNIAKVELPYSIPLSSHRLDLWGNYTAKDKQTAQSLAASDYKVIYSDFYGVVYLQELMAMDKKIYFIPEDFDIKGADYIFLREYSQQTGNISIWTGAGTRKEVNIGDQLSAK